MRDYAREDAGAGVVMASCVDERFPPENMLDGKDGTFWITTGMYPQEFVLALGKTIHVSRITTLSLGGDINLHAYMWFYDQPSAMSLTVKKLSVERGENDKPDSFERVFEAELTNRGDRLQSEVHQVNIKARYLKFTILSGYAEHSTMNRVSVLGESPNGDDAGYNEDDGTNYQSGNYSGNVQQQHAAAESSVGGPHGRQGSAAYGRQGNAGGGPASTLQPSFSAVGSESSQARMSGYRDGGGYRAEGGDTEADE